MKSDDDCRSLHRTSQPIHAGTLQDPLYGAVSVPIFQTSTFAFPNADEGAARFSGEHPGYVYTRMSNPTVNALEDNIACLEKGFKGLATATGMAAIATVLLACLDQQSHCIATDALYGSTRVLMETEFSRFGVASTFVNSSQLRNIRTAMQANTRMVYIETPTNPTMQITDIRGAAELAHQHQALLVVDNTFASPYLQRPLEHGADIVVHSMTKYINGHADVLGGMIVTRNQELYGRIQKALSLFGATMDPHQAWLILRGVRTLPLRIEKAQHNALQLAQFLRSHPKVNWVNYPGFPEHPQYDIARKQMDGGGAMLAFGVKRGLAGGKMVMDHVRLITLAVSLGSVESLIEHPASMTHAAMSQEARERAGIQDELVRLSVGCEDFRDLRDDLDQALRKIPD